MFLAIVAVENNRISKFQEFTDEEAARAHCAQYGGFVHLGTYRPDLYVSGQSVTIQADQETAEQTIARLERALDRHLDEVANTYRYESIRTMVTYATSDHPTFGAEGRAAVAWRDAVYAYGIQVIADVEAEVRTVPTEVELINELPTLASFIQA
jgi:hypothetical protein